MMKTIYKILLLVIAFSLALSCREKEVPYYQDKISLTAAIPYITTKGTAESTSGIINYDYDQALEIGMARIGQNTTPSYPAFINCGDKITASLGAEVSNGYSREIEFITPQFFDNGTDYIRFASWYPANDFTSVNDSTYIDFPIDGSTDVMYGSISVGSKNDPFDTVYFNHALCVYRIHVYAMLLPDEEGEEETVGDRWGGLTGLELKSLPSSCRLTLPLDDQKRYGINYSGSTDITISDPDNNIYYNPGDILPLGIANRRLVAKCIAAPPSSGALSISLTTEHASSSQEISIARNFKPGCAYDIILRFSDHGFINADVSVGEWNDYDEDITREAGANMYYNLSTYGTANSYMIHSANYGYSFDGTVKGNGDASSVGKVSTAINPGYVDILWTDMPAVSLDLTNDGVNNPVSMHTVSLITNSLSQGKVLVKVQGNPDKNDKSLLSEGNVIIAAYTDNTKSEILWTWHLWITDRVKTQGYTNGYAVQDRNLGAVSNTREGSNPNYDYTKMYGLYYQWGRHTPFADPAKGIYTLTRESSTTTAAAAAVHPTTMYGTGGEDWLNSGVSYRNSLWGWISDGADPVKTIYDPCPFGYTVSDYRMWKNMSDFEKQGAFVFDYNEGGVNVSIATYNIWYPFQGSIGIDGVVTKSPHPFFMWSSSISEANHPYYFIYDRAGESNIAPDGQRNIAAPVRCVASRSTSVVTDLSASQTANCYLISKEGYYKFKANIRGNGVGSLFPLGGDHDAVISGDLSGGVNMTPNHVAPLWWQGDLSASYLTGTSTDPQNYMCVSMQNEGKPDADGYVNFYVDNFYKGNVILAAYDAIGNILWTWHIWLTDEPQVVASGKYSLMDRFLGATFAPVITPGTKGTVNNTGTAGNISFADDNQRLSTYGFYYQWGKKDPYPGPPGITGTSNSLESSRWWQRNDNTNAWNVKNAITTSAAATIANTTKNPTAFYLSAGEAAGSGWFPDSFADGYVNPALWGYAVKDFNAQGQTFTKTMHDPCPPGYRTPFHYAWDGEVSGLYSGERYRYIAASEATGTVTFRDGEAGFTDYGIVFNKTTFDNNWYPFTGWRDPQTGYCSSVGTDGRMFTGMPMGKVNTRYYIYTSTNASQRGTGQECGPAYGFMIRCQKE